MTKTELDAMAHMFHLKAEAISRMTPEQHQELNEKGSVDVWVDVPMNLVTEQRRSAGVIHNIGDEA